jgi:hypothetical protein
VDDHLPSGEASVNGQRGVVLVELALTLPILMALVMGAADLGLMGLQVAMTGDAANTIADLIAQGIPEDDPLVLDEMERSGCADGFLFVQTEEPPVITVYLDCPFTSLTTALPDLSTVSASAVTP